MITFFTQKRVIEDIQRKGDDMDRVVDLSKDLQNVLKVSQMFGLLNVCIQNHTPNITLYLKYLEYNTLKNL